jgi:hypothetical protein
MEINLDGLNPAKQLAESIGALGEALEKLTDGISHAVKAGFAGYDAFLTRLSNARTEEIVAQASRAFVANAPLIDELTNFLEDPAETPNAIFGNKFTNRQCIVLKAGFYKDNTFRITKIADKLGGDIVFDAAYRNLLSVLEARSALFETLISMRPPESKADREIVADAVSKYRACGSNLAK